LIGTTTIVSRGSAFVGVSGSFSGRSASTAAHVAREAVAATSERHAAR
jgi:hypothetical protein